METTFDAGIAPLVETRSVGKRYGTTVALDNVTMRIHAGKSVALAGRNGAGKSTLVRLLTGLDRPDAGEGVLPANLRQTFRRGSRGDRRWLASTRSRRSSQT
jgi:ABC-type sugar transport system ATPase subunit